MSFQPHMTSIFSSTEQDVLKNVLTAPFHGIKKDGDQKGQKIKIKACFIIALRKNINCFKTVHSISTLIIYFCEKLKF